MKRKKNVTIQKKSEKTNCNCDDLNWPNLDETVSVANTYLGICSPVLVTVCDSNKYFNMNVYPGVDPSANSTDFILGQSNIRPSLLSSNKHWLNLDESVSVANTYLGIYSPQLATVDISHRYFNRNVYTGANPLENSTDLILGQSNLRTSLLSDKNHWSNLDGSVSVAHTYLGIDSPRLATIGVFDKYSNMSINSNVKPTGYLFDLSQSVVKASLIVDEKNSSSLSGVLSVGNAYMGIGQTELPTVNSFDRYYNKYIYSIGNPTEYIFDFSLRQSVLKDSLFSVNEFNSSIANNYKGIDVPTFQTRSVFDSLTDNNIYSTSRSPLRIIGIDFGQSIVNTDLYSINNFLSVTNSVIFPNESYSKIGLNKVSSLGSYFTFLKNINEVIPSGAVTYYNNSGSTSNQFESRKLGVQNEIEKKFKGFLESIKLDQNHFGFEFTADNYNFHFTINIINSTINSNQVHFGNKYIN